MKKLLLYILALASVSAIVSLAQQRKFTPDQKLRYAAALIDECYVDSVNSDSLVTEAIVAMLHTLDPHSQYSSPEETKELNQPLEGKFSGIGRQSGCEIKRAVSGSDRRRNQPEPGKSGIRKRRIPGSSGNIRSYRYSRK